MYKTLLATYISTMNYQKLEYRKQAQLLLHHKNIKHLEINFKNVLKDFLQIL